MSKKTVSVKTKISAAEQALFAYLDDMLREGTENPPLETDVPANVSLAPAIRDDTPALSQLPENRCPTDNYLPTDNHLPTDNYVEALIDSGHSAHETNAPIAELQEVATELPEVALRPPADAAQSYPVSLAPCTPWHANGRPVWAQTRFNALIFQVGGLKLAVPLVALGLIYPIDRKFNALPHQTPWFLGILRVTQGAIKVIDTAMCVMPERYCPDFREGLKFVITLHGYDWGLACHAVDKTIALEPDSISWRSQRGKRPWMAGTVRDQMCALIDASGFHQVIAAVENSKT